MKTETKLIITAIVMALALFIFGLWKVRPANAASQTLHVEWDYPQGVADLAGFKLYVNGGLICSVTDKLLRAADCSGVIPDGPASYAMTAYTVSNQESKLSAVVSYDPLPPTPSLKSVSE